MTSAILLCLAALFDVKTLPLATPDVHIFLARADRDTQADVFVLKKSAVTILFSQDGKTRSLVLPENATATDVADLDNDGQTELVGVCGDEIVAIPLEEGGAPRNLFTLPTQLANSSSEPYPFVLAVERDGKTLLALPCEETFELRTPAGSLVSAYPLGENAPLRASYGTPFRAWTVDPPRLSGRDGLEGGVSRTFAFEPHLPPELSDSPLHARTFRRATPIQLREAGQLEPDAWPWFSLTRDGRGDMRVLYAMAGPDMGDTLIRIQGYSGKNVAGPERRYPGQLIVLDDGPPDFNHDGYADLLLWSAPDPGISVGRITKLATAGAWQTNLSAHLFSPEKGRYEPVAASRISCSAPIAWFLDPEEAGPLRHCALRDFDGDGRTDLACATAPNRFSVWTFSAGGFDATPAYEHVFSEAIIEMAFKADLAGTGKTSLGIRTEHMLHVLIAPVK